MKPAGQFLLDDPPREPARGVASWYTPGLSDGLGDRLLMFDNTTASSLELLRFKPEFARQPEFEEALRQRVDRLKDLSHPSLGTVRAVEWLAEGDGLALVSNQTMGRRLSEILHEARGPGRAFELLRQVTPVLAALHEQGDGISFGVLTADRIVVTPDGRLVLVEHVLGSALEALRLPTDRLRAEFGLAIDDTAGPPLFDPQADLVQLALVALSLLQGRQIDPFDYPDRCAIWLERVSSGASGSPAPPELCRWLEHALHIDGRSFASASEAHEALLDLPEDSDMQPASRPSLHRTLHALPKPRTPELPPAGGPETGLSTERVDTGTSASDLRRMRLLRWAAAVLILAAGSEAVIIGRLLWRSSGTGTAGSVAAAAVTIESDQPGLQLLVDGKRTGPGALKLDGAGPHSIRVLAPLAPLSTSAAQPSLTGDLDITSEPTGARVVVDGTRRGVTPLTLSLQAGSHIVVVGDGASATTKTVNVAGGGLVQVIAALAPPGPAAGWLSVSAPLELQVIEGGAIVGTTSAPRIMLPSGRHDLELSNAVAGFKTTVSVDIQPGKVATTAVSVPNGTLSVNALPWANVWLDGKAAGTTPIANLEVPLGSHELILRHPQLGERRQTVIVTAKAPVRIVTDLRK